MRYKWKQQQEPRWEYRLFLLLLCFCASGLLAMFAICVWVMGIFLEAWSPLDHPPARIGGPTQRNIPYHGVEQP